MDLLILLQAVLYFCIFISGFFVCIPVGITRSNFDGLCILYADVHKYKAGRTYLSGSTATNCDFPIYFGVFGMIIFGVAAGLCFLYLTIKSRSDKDIGSGVWTLPFIPLNGILALITLVVACMLSVGFKIFCDGLEDHTISCVLFENQKFNNKTNTGSFVGLASLSQAGAWVGFFLFLAQTGISVLRFFRSR